MQSAAEGAANEGGEELEVVGQAVAGVEVCKTCGCSRKGEDYRQIWLSMIGRVNVGVIW